MSELSNKYNIPESTVKKMMADGVLSCSWAKWDEIYQCFKQTKQITGKSDSAVAMDVSAKTGESHRNILYIVERFK